MFKGRGDRGGQDPCLIDDSSTIDNSCCDERFAFLVFVVAVTLLDAPSQYIDVK